MKLLLTLACASLAAVSGFSVPAATPAASLASHSVVSVRRAAVCAPAPASVEMRCRTNTKREKFFRNLENAKRFRKSIWKPFGSRVQKEAEVDTSVLSTIYVATDANGDALAAAADEGKSPSE